MAALSRSRLADVALAGDVARCRALIDIGSPVNAREGRASSTALHLAARGGHAEVCRLLVARGADTRARASWGETPLHWAAAAGRAAACAALVSLRASSAPDNNGSTPLHFALFSSAEGSAACVAALAPLFAPAPERPAPAISLSRVCGGGGGGGSSDSSGVDGGGVEGAGCGDRDGVGAPPSSSTSSSAAAAVAPALASGADGPLSPSTPPPPPAPRPADDAWHWWARVALEQARSGRLRGDAGAFAVASDGALGGKIGALEALGGTFGALAAKARSLSHAGFSLWGSRRSFRAVPSLPALPVPFFPLEVLRAAILQGQGPDGPHKSGRGDVDRMGRLAAVASDFDVDSEEGHILRLLGATPTAGAPSPLASSQRALLSHLVDAASRCDAWTRRGGVVQAREVFQLITQADVEAAGSLSAALDVALAPLHGA